MKLSIIIVSYNTLQLLKNCLESAYQALSFANLRESSEVIVVDNASTDDSVAMVQKNFPNVRLIRNTQNLGFAKANNQGIRSAKGKYILLLNSDTESKEDALSKLLELIEESTKVAVVGGKLLNDDGSIQASVGFSPNFLKIFCWMTFLDDLPGFSSFVKPYHVEDEKFYLQRQDVDWVSGAAFLVRRAILSQIGLLDESIFMYGEEVEWCYRIKKAGFKIVYQPEAEVFHHKGASSKVAELAGLDKEFAAIMFLYRKHKPAWQLFLVRIFLIFGALLRIVLFGIIIRNPKKAALYANALKMAR